MPVPPEVNQRVENTASPVYFRSPISAVAASYWKAYVCKVSFYVSNPQGATVRIYCGLNKFRKTQKEQTSSMLFCGRNQKAISDGAWSGATPLVEIEWGGAPGKGDVTVDVPSGSSFFQFVFYDCDQNTAPPDYIESPEHPLVDEPVSQGWGMIEFINGTSGSEFTVSYEDGYDFEKKTAIDEEWQVLNLNGVTFAQGFEIKQDNGDGVYPKPHWVPYSDEFFPLLQPSPYLYVAVPGKNTLYIEDANWKKSGGAISGTPAIRALGSENIDIPEGAGVLETVDDQDERLCVKGRTASVPFTTRTKFFRPFTLQWQISFTTFDGKRVWEEAGTTQHPIYVSLAVPESEETPFRTVVHLACGYDGATTLDAAVEKTWEFFKPQSPRNWIIGAWKESEKAYLRKLYYYKPGTKFSENTGGYAAELLKSANDSGQCSTWASLLYKSCKLNGGNVVGIKATVRELPFNIPLDFLVKDWSYEETPTKTIWEGKFKLYGNDPDNPDIPDMCPPPLIGTSGLGVYGELTNLLGIPGQNSGDVAPSQKLFGNHIFLKHIKSDGGEEYLDPSYGVTYADQNDFKNKALEMVGEVSPSSEQKGYAQFECVKAQRAIFDVVFTQKILIE